MLNQCTIYGLADPRTGEMRYIGSALDPDQRLKRHLSAGAPKIKQWADELKALGLSPKQVKLATCSTHLRYTTEESIRAYYAQTCNLLNSAVIPKDTLYTRVVTERVVREVYVRVLAPEPHIAVSKTAYRYITDRAPEGDSEYFVDLLVQNSMEYEALQGMELDDEHPELAEDCDLELEVADYRGLSAKCDYADEDAGWDMTSRDYAHIRYLRERHRLHVS